MADQVIGVIGATGQQGGAVVDALLDAGAPVRAIVRDTRSAKSTALRDRGVDVVGGDQDRPDELVEPLRGLGALYLMTTFTGADGTEGEIRRGVAVGDAAAAAGVPRVVYSSVGGAERDSGVPHFESKRRIEKHLESVVPVQFVRPVYFMDNLAGQLPSGSGDGSGPDPAEFVLRLPMPADVPLQMVAVRDIGRVGAAALLDENALGGLAIEIGGDELTGAQAAGVIGEYLARPARFEAVPVDSLGDADLQAMFTWFVDTPAYQADLARTRAVDPHVLNLATWLRQR